MGGMTRERRIPRALERRPSLRHAARIYLTVRRWRLDGWTLAECCVELNRMGETTWRGRKWAPQRLSQVLRTGGKAALDYIDTRDWSAWSLTSREESASE